MVAVNVTGSENYSSPPAEHWRGAFMPIVATQTKTAEQTKRVMDSRSACVESLINPKCDLGILYWLANKDGWRRNLDMDA